MGHNHDHGSVAAEGTSNRTRLAIAFGLTATVVVAQAIGSYVTGSLALLTDTAHAVTDASGLLVALVAATLMLKPGNKQRTWGFRRVEVLAALGQALLLLGVGTYAVVEAISRLSAPPEVPGSEMLIFGVVGLAANLIAIMVLASGRGQNLNMKAAFLEVLNDALGSLGVIIAAIVIATTGFQQADTIAGLFIAALILPRAFILLKDTVAVLMEFTPKGLDLDEVRAHLLELEHVSDVHDLHASTVASGLPVLSAHLVVDDKCFQTGHAAELLATARECIAEHFDIPVHHSTLQLETKTIRDTEAPTVSHP